ncbi:radical SAM protein [Glycomyces sp. L485]|uniref:radical SAM protein n=1 Tax=Glycomyces sp. L485 TaxID=2909235 RepID=UPI001F4B756E|nr:radical SAM protein [Glycomyces sp. L485]MCH7232165.1 radical SAM protein [Glycomyces sp. L485]
MHLADLLSLRTVPAAGVLVSLTDRCPLSCAHCSTSSNRGAPQFGEEPFLAFSGTWTDESHPEVVFLSGGEPLLRPGLVRRLAARGRACGAATAVLSGMYFCRSGGIPPPIERAIRAVDHFSASIDVFHEREVPRTDVFAALHTVRSWGVEVSLHTVGARGHDPYLRDLVDRIRDEFDSEVPVLVASLRSAGRAAEWAPRHDDVLSVGPCEFASWPLIDSDGTIFACCQGSMLRRLRPPHLVLGNAADTAWRTVRDRVLTSPHLRSVRTIGPIGTASAAGLRDSGGICGTCVGLDSAESLPSDRFLTSAERLVPAIPARTLAARWGAGPYADAVEWGRSR